MVSMHACGIAKIVFKITSSPSSMLMSAQNTACVAVLLRYRPTVSMTQSTFSSGKAVKFVQSLAKLCASFHLISTRSNWFTLGKRLLSTAGRSHQGGNQLQRFRFAEPDGTESAVKFVHRGCCNRHRGHI